MEQEKLTSEQAFNVLVQIANQVKLTLQEGEAVKQALQIVAGLVRAEMASKDPVKAPAEEVETAEV